MGRSIDLYSYDYEKLVNKIAKVCKTDDKPLIEKILNCCGNKVADRYVLLNQEFWDDYSCYYNVATVLDKVFKTEDIFSDVFCTFDSKSCDRKQLISGVDKWDVYRKIGFEPEEE